MKMVTTWVHSILMNLPLTEPMHRKLSDYFSLAVAGRFIYSNLTQGQTVQGVETKPGISVAADVAIYWEKDVNWFKSMDAKFAWGMDISNIGQKISYTSSNIEQDFIPTNLRIGPRLTLNWTIIIHSHFLEI